MSREVANFRTFWKATTFSSLLEPTIYLLAFGLGLGATIVSSVASVVSIQLINLNALGAFRGSMQAVSGDADGAVEITATAEEGSFEIRDNGVLVDTVTGVDGSHSRSQVTPLGGLASFW